MLNNKRIDETVSFISIFWIFFWARAREHNINEYIEFGVNETQTLHSLKKNQQEVER